MKSDGTFVRDILYDIFYAVNILAILIFTPQHKVKKARNANIDLLLVRKTTFLASILAFSK
jgi:hypothetical protein